MDLRTGEIKALKDISEDDLKHFTVVRTPEMTKKQMEEKQVSLKDHRSKLGKKLTKKRKELSYSQMTKNQKRNMRKKLKGVK